MDEPGFDAPDILDAPVTEARDIHEVLKSVFGYSSFREGQEEVIRKIIDGRDVLGVMPTGAGKSICYQVPALALNGCA
ncbi:MAG: DEAD/DEAH box helicase, partial [Clostridia bacterium]|nr:DEAD/DEAH box helicase [Clostridia bacterium]